MCLLALALVVGVGFLVYRIVVSKRRQDERAALLKVFNLSFFISLLGIIRASYLDGQLHRRKLNCPSCSRDTLR